MLTPMDIAECVCGSWHRNTPEATKFHVRRRNRLAVTRMEKLLHPLDGEGNPRSRPGRVSQ